MPDLRAEALILTGSMARGEATAVSTASGFLCLSDMEFLIVIGGRNRGNREAGEIARIAREVQEQSQERGLACSFEFTPALPRYFRNVRPSIFSYELRRHGRVVWGDVSFLEHIPPFEASAIPRQDAFFLICNRMIEQLDWRVKLDSPEPAEATRLFAYSVVKTYVDLATSLLIFAGAYEPSYSARASRLDALELFISNDIPEFEQLLDRIKASTKTKLDPPVNFIEPLSRNECDTRWTELACHLLRVWQWELERLEVGSCKNSLERAHCFARGATLRERLVGWGKLARDAWRQGNSSDLLWSRCLSGVPRHLLYLEAAALYAECAGLGEELLWCNSLPTGFLAQRQKESCLKERIINLCDVWKKYFRNA